MNIYKTKDRKLIFELDKTCFIDFYSQELINSLDGHHIFYLIEEYNEIIGFIILNNYDENEYELIKIGIIPKWRFKGCAERAMHILFSTINWKKMFLEVDEKNTPAIKLYYKLKFNFIAKREKYYKNGNNALVFVLENK